MCKYIKFISFCVLLCYTGFSYGCKHSTKQEQLRSKIMSLKTQLKKGEVSPKDTIRPRTLTGADILIMNRLEDLKGKKIGIVANHTAMLKNGVHLVDSLQKIGISIVKVFSPEHGFRGTADAGEKVKSSIDGKTGLPLISLYGNNKKPTAEQLADIDILLFDIQDVGSRHYTYISTLSYVMEACAEQGKKLMVLDRPNPNGGYVDGPVMEKAYTSFIGMHPIPIVHGLTIGEYARMVNGEGWLKNGVKCDLQVIECEYYSHFMYWDYTHLQWIPPSPNLGTEYAAYLYPILCWFEATPVSVGRGTDEAFMILGAPWNKGLAHQKIENMEGNLQMAYGLVWENYTFTPHSIVGKSKNPPFQDQSCKGIKFTNRVQGKELFLAGLTILEAFYKAHQKANTGKPFFIEGAEKWTGYSEFRKQIAEGKSPEEIYNSWQPKVEEFKALRKKYLLYD